MPVPVGGAGQLAAALVAVVESAGGTVRTGSEVTRVVIERDRAVGVEVAGAGPVRARRAVLADTGPGALFGGLVADHPLPTRFLEGLAGFRYGDGDLQGRPGPRPARALEGRRPGGLRRGPPHR